MEPEIHKALLSAMSRRKKDFEDVFGRSDVTAEQLTTDMLILDRWEPARSWALKQAEETFCDFVALKIFASSYLHAFSFLLSPGHSMPRSVNYPGLRTRVENLVRCAEAYEIEPPANFKTWFEEDSTQRLGAIYYSHMVLSLQKAK